MIALPLIYFSIWLVRSYKKNGVSIGTYIILLFVITSFFSVMIDMNDFYVSHSCPKVELGVFAPLLYIVLISLCIYPFYKMGKLNIQREIPKNIEKVLVRITLFYFGIFLLVLSVSFTRINEILLTESIVTVRNAQYTGDAVSFYDYLHGPLRYMCALCSILSQSSLGMLLVFGYLMAFSRRSGIFGMLALVSSMTPLLISINIADRSQYFYWIVLAGLSVVLFYPYFSSERKRVLYIFMGSIVALIITYFMTVTVARFGERDTGTEGGLITYAGQSYINFCRFINKLETINSIRLFTPTINTFVLHGGNYFELVSIVERLNARTPIGVFPTFLGIIYSVCGPFVLILFLIVYCIISNNFLRKYKYRVLNISHLFKLWALSAIPSVGIITYIYITSDISLIIWLLLSVYLKKQLK